jgi:hypothetical protein
MFRVISWLRKHLYKKGRHAPVVNRPRRPPLWVETLEDRVVPSTVIWQDALSDTDGTDIAAHAPSIPSGGAYTVATGDLQIIGNTLQGANDGGANRVIFDPGDANPTTASVDFYLSDAGTYASTYYNLGLITHYGADDQGGEGYEAFLACGVVAAGTWTLELRMVDPYGGAVMAETNLPLSQDTWYTLQIATDPNNNITASVPGVGSCSAADPDAAYMANTQFAIETDAANEFSLRNIVVTEPVVTLASPNNQTSYDGDTVSVPLAATDSLSNALTYTDSGLPSGLSVNSGGVITGTLASNADQGGPYTVTVTATDSVTGDSATQTFGWNVAPVPTVALASPGDQSNYDGDSVSLPLTSSDSAGNPLTFTESGLPSGVYVNSYGDILGSIAGNADQSGPYTVTVTATDAAANVSATQTFDWNVYSNPVASNATWSVGHDVRIPSIDLSQDVSGGDGTQLQVSIVSDPVYGQLTENEDGTYAYTPPSQWTGTDSFTIQATDGTKESNVATITIDVTNSTLVWNGLGSDNLGSDAMNWIGDVAPINGDTVVFNGTSAKNADLDANFPATLTEMDVNAGYTGQITLQQDLTVNTLLSQSAGTIVLGSNNLNVASGGTYNMSAGNLDGPGYLDIAGTVNWTGGSWDPADAEITGALRISPSSSVSLTGWTVNVNSGGQLDWTQGNVENADSTVNVATGGAFNIFSSGIWADARGDGGSVINNAGLLCSTGGTCESPVSIDAALNSSSDLGVEGGKLSLQDGGGLAGLLDIQAHASLILTNGIFVAQALAQTVNQGQGAFVVDGATSQALNLVIAAAPNLGFPSVSLQNLELRAGGEITGAGDLQIRGTFTWSGGTLGGTGSLQSDGNFRISTPTAQFGDRPLDNRGTLVWTPNVAGTPANTAIYMALADESTNSGSFEVTAPAGRVLKLTSSGGAADFTNAGTITITGPGTVVFAASAALRPVRIFNRGSIALRSGEFTVGGADGTSGSIINQGAGYIDAARGTTVTLMSFSSIIVGSGPQTNRHVLRGQGIFDIFGWLGSGANSSVEANHLRLEPGGFIFIGGTLTVHDLDVEGGTLSAGTNAANGQLVLGTRDKMQIHGDFRLTRVNVVNHGTIDWEPGCSTITMGSLASFDTDGGIFDILTSGGSIVTDPSLTGNDPAPGTFTISNGGTLRKENEDAFAVTLIQVPVVNTNGTVTTNSCLELWSYLQGGGNALLNSTAPHLWIGVSSNLSSHSVPAGTTLVAGGTVNAENLVTYNLSFTCGASGQLGGMVRGLLAIGTESRVDLNGTLGCVGESGEGSLSLDAGAVISLHGNILVAPRQISNAGTIQLQNGTVRGPLWGGGRGTVVGPGTWNGNEVVQIGTLAVSRNLMLLAGSAAFFQISDLGNDLAAVAGNASLGGELEVNFTATQFSVGQAFTVMTFSSYNGAFANSAIAIDADYYLEVVYNADSVSLVVQAYV